MRKILLVLLCTGIGSWLIAQTVEPTVVSTAGSSGSGKAISLEWTLGEVAIQSLYHPGGILTQGYHQPNLIVTEHQNFVAEVIAPHLQVNLSPNPVKSILNVKMQSDLEGVTTISLHDLNGTPLQSIKANLQEDNVEINLSRYQAGMYLLHLLTEEGKALKSFKVIKVH